MTVASEVAITLGATHQPLLLDEVKREFIMILLLPSSRLTQVYFASLLSIFGRRSITVPLFHLTGLLYSGLSGELMFYLLVRARF